jgi:MFS family permease
MFMFAAAFIGSLLLVPTYFQQVRGESSLHAGLLVAPQGLGAMLTMPIAGRLVDKIPIGRIVPVGLTLIIIGLFGFTQISETTSYPVICGMLLVMGMGMGSTMMPLFTSAMKTLSAHEVARGSTLLNISQQVSSSVGIALISVVLTSHLNDSPLVSGTERVPGGPLRETDVAILANTQPDLFGRLGIGSDIVTRGIVETASSFAQTYWVAWVLVLCTLVPALMLPRRREETHFLDDEGVPPIVVS